MSDDIKNKLQNKIDFFMNVYNDPNKTTTLLYLSEIITNVPNYINNCNCVVDKYNIKCKLIVVIFCSCVDSYSVEYNKNTTYIICPCATLEEQTNTHPQFDNVNIHTIYDILYILSKTKKL